VTLLDNKGKNGQPIPSRDRPRRAAPEIDPTVPNAEEQIRRAIEEGKFDNLPGKGKPLNLEQNPFEDPEWRLANHVLITSGFSLPWIEKRARSRR